MTIAISGLSRSGRILAAVEGALAVGAMLAAIAVAMGLHVSARQGAERELRRLAVVLAEQTSRTLQAIDLVLADVANEAEVVASEDPAHFRSIMATPAMQRALHARIAGLPQADAILVIDADGTGAAVLARLADGAGQRFRPRLFPGRARRHLARAIPQRAGQQPRNRQLGVPYRPLRPRPLGRVAGRAAGGDRSRLYFRFSCRHRAAARHGRGAGPPGRGGADPFPGGHGARSRRRHPRPAREREPAWWYGQPLANFPAAIEVSISRAAMFADWRRQVAWLAGGTACGLLCMLLLLRGLVRQFHRLEAARAAVQEKSAAVRDHARQHGSGPDDGHRRQRGGGVQRPRDRAAGPAGGADARQAVVRRRARTGNGRPASSARTTMR